VLPIGTPDLLSAMLFFSFVPAPKHSISRVSTAMRRSANEQTTAWDFPPPFFFSPAGLLSSGKLREILNKKISKEELQTLRSKSANFVSSK